MTTRPPLLLAIDQGTTNSKVVVFDRAGTAVASASRRVPIEYPRPGWVQTDAMSLVATVVDALAECRTIIEAEALGEIAAIGICNQRETVVMWDAASGLPLGPAISWQCGRGIDHCARVAAAGHGPMVHALSGLPLAPMFSAPKLAWLFDSVPDARERAADGEVRIGTVDSWLLWHLTAGAVHATDLTNASRTSLLDLERLQWSSELCNAFEVPIAALPEVRASADRFGVVADNGVVPWLAGLPITAVAGDSHAALVGHGAFGPGTVKATFGTGTSVMAPVPTAVRGLALVDTIGWSWRTSDDRVIAVPAVEGNITVTGAALDWTATLLGVDVADLDELATAAAGDAGVTFVPALAGLGAPHWVPEARGLVIGLTRGAGRAELARATFEAIGHQVADVIDALTASGVAQVHTLSVDGGAMRSETLARTVATLTSVEVRRTHVDEAAAFGVALLAGLGAGIYEHPDDLQTLLRPSDSFVPMTSAEDRRSARERWQRALVSTIAAASHAQEVVDGHS